MFASIFIFKLFLGTHGFFSSFSSFELEAPLASREVTLIGEDVSSSCTKSLFGEDEGETFVPPSPTPQQLLPLVTFVSRPVKTAPSRKRKASREELSQNPKKFKKGKYLAITDLEYWWVDDELALKEPEYTIKQRAREFVDTYYTSEQLGFLEILSNSLPSTRHGA